jgi:hypothetical protein
MTRVLGLPILILGAVVLAISLLTSCGSSKPPGPPSPPSGPFPPRPRDLNVSGIDPCTLITPQVRGELNGLSDRFSHRKALDSLASADCTTNSTPNVPAYGLVIRLVTSEEAAQEMAPGATITMIAGFGAIQQPGLSDTQGNSCLITVDSGAGQAVWVGFGTADGTPAPGGYAAMCAKAHIAAEGVMHELLARTP